MTKDTSPISLLLLKRATVERVHLESRGADAEASAGYESQGVPSLSFTVLKRSDAQEFRIQVEFGINWDRHTTSPIDSLSVRIEGEFAFREEMTEERLKTYIPVLGVANLIGIARGLIANMTALFPGGAFIVPLFDVHLLIKKSLSDQAGGAEEDFDDEKGSAVELKRPRKANRGK